MSFRPYQPPKKSTIPVGHDAPSAPPAEPREDQCPVILTQEEDSIQKIVGGGGLHDTPEERKIFNTFSDTKISPATGNSNAGIIKRVDSHGTPSRDVHQFERSFEYKINVPEYDEKMKGRVFTFIKKKVSKEAGGMIDEIAKVSRGRNVDNVTGYIADDLLFYLLLNGQGEDLLSNIDEQLADAYRLGRCPQGRTIRTLSLINAFC